MCIGPWVSLWPSADASNRKRHSLYTAPWLDPQLKGERPLSASRGGMQTLTPRGCWNSPWTPALPQPRPLTKKQRLDEPCLRILAVTSTCTSRLCQLPTATTPALPQQQLLSKAQRLDENCLPAMGVTSTWTSRSSQLPEHLMCRCGHSQHFQKQVNSQGWADINMQLSTGKMQPETIKGANACRPKCHVSPTSPNYFPLTHGSAYDGKWWASATITHVGKPRWKLGHLHGLVSGSSHPARFTALTPTEMLKHPKASSYMPPPARRATRPYRKPQTSSGQANTEHKGRQTASLSAFMMLIPPHASWKFSTATVTLPSNSQVSKAWYPRTTDRLSMEDL